ncbi:hypothetical protein H2248_006073 [Termitomyces sp. 'cryptogamus']|nr:hypothetical protein H2248_006073 [Termitomyces sp. 'cryptogamus']
MQMTIKEEETERRSGRKKRITEGRQRHLNLGGIGLKGKKVKEDPSKIDDFEVLRRAGMGQEQKGEPPITPALLARSSVRKRMLHVKISYELRKRSGFSAEVE